MKIMLYRTVRFEFDGGQVEVLLVKNLKLYPISYKKISYLHFKLKFSYIIYS